MNVSSVISRLAALLCVVSVLSSGCSSTGDSSLSAAETAKAVARIRLEAKVCLTRFQNHADDPDIGADIADLQCYVDKHKRTTELFPSPAECPSCFARYGEGLRMMATYYRTLSVKQEHELKRRPGSADSAELKKLAAKNEKLAQGLYRKALTQFNLHLRSPGPIDVRVYWRGFECASRLERYKVAMEYLDAYERNMRLVRAEKQRVEKWRDWAQGQYEILLRRQVRDELGG
jgi:hypothetical protein